jgi:hypothetical protein
MKFSHSLQLNSAPEWREQYIDYDRLKKTIYILEKATLGLGPLPVSVADLETSLQNSTTANQRGSIAGEASDTGEGAPLLTTPSTSLFPSVPVEDANRFFLKRLQDELDKILVFYGKKELELMSALRNFIQDVTKAERQEETYLHSLWTQENTAVSKAADLQVGSRSSSPRPHQKALDEYDNQSVGRSEIHEDIEVPLPGFLPFLIWSSSTLKTKRQQLMRRAVQLFVELTNLQEYIQINETGFSKVLKKYEKVVGAKIKSEYLSVVEASHPFLDTTKNNLEHAVDGLVQWYARIATDGKKSAAESDLKSHLKERVVWERNTIWLDMVENERRTESIGFQTVFDSSQGRKKTVTIWFCGCPITIPTEIPGNFVTIVFATSLLIFLCNTSLFQTPQQNNCFGILVFASILWAFEAIPLFVTSMIIPALIVGLRVMNVDGKRLDSKAAAKLIFSGILILIKICLVLL